MKRGTWNSLNLKSKVITTDFFSIAMQTKLLENQQVKENIINEVKHIQL